MKEVELELINKLGLHARAAAQLSDKAMRFQSSIKLHLHARNVDAKDILGVMTIGAKFGDHITLQAEGPDEDSAIEQLSALVKNRFGESE